MVKHKVDWCSHCERYVVLCAKCGNNTCNGGYGEVDGKKCDTCPSAYKFYEYVCSHLGEVISGWDEYMKDDKWNREYEASLISEKEKVREYFMVELP